ncbi:hypothetical protein, partial [Blautia wexlerae]
IAYFIIEKKKAAPQPWQAIAQRFCSIRSCGGVVMHKTILIEEITIENVTEKINEKVQEMEKDGYQIKTMSFWGTDKAVLIFKKGLKGSLL